MKIEVLVNNKTKAAVSESLVKKTVQAVIIGESDAFPAGGRIELSVVFVGPARIRQLNKQYRAHDTVTDVLSFAEADIPGNGQADRPTVLGELVICAQQVKEDARDSNVSLKRELAWVVVHGVLHLFGYDHEIGPDQARAMREKEEFYLSNLNIF